MDGGQDMGGLDGFGAIVPEPDEPVFHAPWERRAFALTLAMARPGGWTIDMSRFAREDRAAADYLRMSYYEIWLAGLERLIRERNLISSEELARREAIAPAKPLPVLRAGEVAAMLRAGAPTERAAAAPARFSVGDRVRAKTVAPRTHSRLPRYVRGHIGSVVRIHGCHVLPDANAHGWGEQPQWLYTVVFDGRELWGDAAAGDTKVSVDAWETYLEPA